MGLGVRLMELVELVVQNQLKAVGIDVVIRNEVARTFFGTTLKRRQYGGLALFNGCSTSATRRASSTG